MWEQPRGKDTAKHESCCGLPPNHSDAIHVFFTTLTLYPFFYNHVVVEFKIYIFFSLWFQTST